MKTREYLAAYRAAIGITSDYATAKALGASRQVVSRWQLGEESPGTLYAFKIADTLGLPPDQVVADIELERAERSGQADKASAWRLWVQRLGSVAASVMAAVILSSGAMPRNANAGNALGAVPERSSLYIVAHGKRRRRAPGAQAIAALADTLGHRHCAA